MKRPDIHSPQTKQKHVGGALSEVAAPEPSVRTVKTADELSARIEELNTFPRDNPLYSNFIIKGI